MAANLRKKPEGRRSSPCLTTPANNATFTDPATVSLSASATDTEGTIARVDFYHGSNLLFSDADVPIGLFREVI